jgi:Glycosyl hydrolase family 26
MFPHLRLATLVIAFMVFPVAGAQAGTIGSKRACVYSAHSIATLAEFDNLVGRDIDCVVVYNNASPDWYGWETPWFTRHITPDHDWAAWATQPGTNRKLVISQNLFPASEDNTDWRTAGARGDYMDHGRALARNLVAAGLGDSVIRLSHEANGTWGPDNIGTTQQDFDLWRQTWRNTVLAMRSVPGANFQFDWTVNARYRAIPLANWYPGDDVVDIIGIDAYDSGIGSGLQRWPIIYGNRIGIGDVLGFATAHHKPLSIPEWGVAPTTTQLSGGDDPGYVDGIASVVRNNDVAYQAYFYNHDWATQLATGVGSLASYRRHFGAGGDSVNDVAPDPSTPAPSPVAPVKPVTSAAPTGKATTTRAKAKKRHAKVRHKRHRRKKRRHR